MSNDFRLSSPTQWEWSHEGKRYGLQLFSRQGTLIWSSWIVSEGRPQFEPGTRQTFAAFLEGVPSQYAASLPDGLLDSVRAVIRTLGNL